MGNSTCVATIVNDTCDVKVASVQHPVVVENQTITLNSDKYPNIGELKSYASDSPNASQGDLTDPLGGLSWSFENRWWAFRELFQFLDPGTNTTIYVTDMDNPIISNQYTIFSKENTTNTNGYVITFNRPTDDIIKSLS